MTTSHAIEIAGLIKSYGDREVLRGVDLAVPRGTVLALLGSNGAGKTTTVRILTGRENLVLVAQLRRLEHPHRIADELLERFALSEVAERRTATYSGGMRRRLDIAMSLIGDPPVLFLDEPTTGLDPQARNEVWKTVRELAGHGTTVLLTTQYLEEAEQLADRIAILHEGRIIAEGTLAELRQLFPPTVVEYVEKQPTLEEVFLAVVGHDGGHHTPDDHADADADADHTVPQGDSR